MKLIIDRFEGNYAVCEKPGREMVNIPRSLIPADAKEGDVLIVKGKEFRIDAAETARRKKAAEDLLNDLTEH